MLKTGNIDGLEMFIGVQTEASALKVWLERYAAKQLPD